MTLQYKRPRNAPAIKVGTIILAKPCWVNNRRYRRSAILIVEHNREGSIGVIINKHSNMDVHTALNELSIYDPLLYGGESNKRLVVFLHNGQIPESVYITNDIFLGGDYEELKEMHKLGQIDMSKFRFVAGCVEWDYGQLDKEMREGKWWATSTSAKEYFSATTENFWADKLTADGCLYGLFGEYPDPSIN